MRHFFKNTAIGITLGLILATFTLPISEVQAQIFGGATNENDIPYGICLDQEAVKNPSHPHYEACQGVDCQKPKNEEERIKCTSEAEAGTGIAQESLEASGITHTDNFADFIKKLINFALPYLALAAFLAYVYAGFLYVTALGDDDQVGTAKKIILWTSVGLIVVILSYAITQFFTRDLVNELNSGNPPNNGGNSNLNQLSN